MSLSVKPKKAAVKSGTDHADYDDQIPF